MQNLDGKSMNIIEQNIEKLKEIFPEVFSEGKIDFSKLEEELGFFKEKSDERYNFTWNGKSEAKKIALTPSTGTLRPCKEESKDWDTTQNLYIEGDNLEVLKLLQKSYHKKVKMIYIDPPYNTGKDFVYKDNFRDNIKNYLEITGQVDNDGNKLSTNSETSGRYHSDWLNMMYSRLKLARNLLKDDGVIFISIDDNEVANLRKLCDEIFGEDNFINEFAWRRTDNQSNIGNSAKVKEYILCYAKIKQPEIFNKLPLSVKAKNEYSYEDEFGKFRRKNILDKSRGKKYYNITAPNGDILTGPWMIDETEFLLLNNSGKIYWASEKMPYGKKYLHESEGQIISDWLSNEFGTNQRASEEIDILFNKRAFDFPKPTQLIITFLTIGSNPNDIILDFFSGSATTAHAVMKLNSEEDGNRKFICVQLPELISEKSEAYKAGYKNICEIGKERIRRAGEKVKSESGKDDLDIGFKVLKLDSSNIKSWDSDFENLETNLLDAVENIKSDRNEEDLLYEILLKYGLDLTLPIEEKEVNGKKLYNIGFGALIICLDSNISIDITDEIIAIKKEYDSEITRVVFKDSGFKNATEKTNIIKTLNQNGIDEVVSV
ncbi:MAG: site-specific DNA-methyltransferase [Aliarcobacter sp.]